MSMETEIVQHKEYLEIIVFGKFDIQKSAKKFSQVLNVCKSTGLFKVLIDYRKLEGEVYAIQKILAGHKFVILINDNFGSKSRDLKFAFIGKAPQLTSYRPGLEMVEKGKIQVIATDDIYEAFEWLNINET